MFSWSEWGSYGEAVSSPKRFVMLPAALVNVQCQVMVELTIALTSMLNVFTSK